MLVVGHKLRQFQLEVIRDGEPFRGAVHSVRVLRSVGSGPPGNHRQGVLTGKEDLTRELVNELTRPTLTQVPEGGT